MGCREREVDEKVVLGLEIGGELARLGGMEYLEAEKTKDPKGKLTALKLKAKGLIIQNPHSGFGLGRGKRRFRFHEVSIEYFWRVPKISFLER